jgi:hypothetical protein
LSPEVEIKFHYGVKNKIIMKPKIQEGNFQEVINQVIAEGRHPDYLKQVLKDYEAYKQEFEWSFSDKNPKEAVYRFRVNYLLKKPVWREIELFGSQTFEDLAETIIDSMGWDNDHMHGFSFPDRKSKNPMQISPYTFFADGWEDDPHPTFKSNEIRIYDIDYVKQPKLKFIFDFGDGHIFDIEFKEMRKLRKKEINDKFPCIIDQRGIGPEQYPDYD